MSHLPKILTDPDSRLVKANGRTCDVWCTLSSVGESHYLLYDAGKVLGEIFKINTRWWGALIWQHGKKHSRRDDVGAVRRATRQSAVDWLFRISKNDVAALSDLSTTGRRLLEMDKP